MLEQQVLRLLQPPVSHLRRLLAFAPARGDDPVPIGVDDRRVLPERVGLRGDVDVDVGPGRKGREILDVEVRLTAPRAIGLSAPSLVDMEPAHHSGCLRGAEIARLEVREVGPQEGLELVDGDPLAASVVALLIEIARTVRVGELGVGEAVVMGRRRGGVRAGHRRGRGRGRRGNAVRGAISRPARVQGARRAGGDRRPDPLGEHRVIESEDRGDVAGDVAGKRHRLAGCAGGSPAGESHRVEGGVERPRRCVGAPAERDQQPVG